MELSHSADCKRVCCSFFHKTYADKKGLSRHTLKCHPDELDSGSLLCPLCNLK